MPNKEISTQAIVIGAGPAGAGTSLYLSQHGIEHVIIDKATFPRDKVCGDACSGKSAYVLRNLNSEWLDEIFDNTKENLPSHGIVFVAPNGKRLEIPYIPDRKPEDRAPGFTAKREDFDNYLFNKLSSEHATILQGSSVIDIKRTEDGVTVNINTPEGIVTINAPVIVGADGDKSIIRKQFLSDHATPKTSAVGLRAYYKGVTGMNDEQYIELHFLPEVLPGYLWIFPLPNGNANVGVGITSDLIRKKKINLREKMLYAINNNPQLKDRFSNASLDGKILGWGLPMGTEQLPVSGNNFLLTGDAASLVDPFSGEGIGNALYSGMLAANAIAKGTKEDNYSRSFFEEEYDKVLYKRLGDELKLSTTMQKMCRYPWLFNFVVNKAQKSPSLSKTISFMFTDLDMRELLKKPSFYLKILFNK